MDQKEKNKRIRGFLFEALVSVCLDARDSFRIFPSSRVRDQGEACLEFLVSAAEVLVEQVDLPATEWKEPDLIIASAKGACYSLLGSMLVNEQDWIEWVFQVWEPIFARLKSLLAEEAEGRPTNITDFPGR